MTLFLSSCIKEIQTISSTNNSRNGESIDLIKKIQREKEKEQLEAKIEIEKFLSKMAKIENE